MWTRGGKRTKRLSLARGGVNSRIGKVKTVHVGVGGPSQWCDLPEEPLADKDVHLFKSPGHHRNWLDCIRSRERPVADVEIGARSVTVCHLANLACWNRRKLRWDPKNWTFIGDKEANTWLDRARRAPWQLPKV